MTSMLPLPQFKLLQPTTVAEALEMLATNKGAKLISGGTDLLPSMKHGLFEPKVLVSTKRIAGLKEISIGNDELSIGAGVTHATLRRSDLVSDWAPALIEACKAIATPTLQSMATIGGNILLDTRCVFYNQTRFWRESIDGCLKCDGSVCHVVQNKKECFAAHSADTVPVLMVMGAKVVIAGPQGERTVAIETLYGKDGRDSGMLEPSDLLVRVIIPKTNGEFGYRKLRMRGAIDYPLVVTAVQVSPSGGRVVISGVGPSPIEIEGISSAIESGDFSKAGEIARSQVKPLGTHNVSPNWRRHMVGVEVRRCLEETSLNS